MFLDEDNNIISIGEKQISLDSVLESLSNLSGKQVSDFFQNRQIKLPRKLNMLALNSVLNAQVKDAKKLDLTDELRYRLLFYPSFTEYQLQSFMNVLEKPSLEKAYKSNLWLLLLKNANFLDLDDSEINFLLYLPESNEQDDFLSYETHLQAIEFDAFGEFDGLNEYEFANVLPKSSTLTELREIGQKYGLNIPRRLKREELFELICERLEDEGKLDESTKSKLSQMSVLMLQRFAKTNGIKLSVELKKDELVDFILRAARKTNLNRGPALGNYAILAENIFEFQEEFVKDIIVPVAKTSSQPREVEQIVTVVPAEIDEEKLEAIIRKILNENQPQEPTSISEDKINELIDAKIGLSSVESSISEESLVQLIDKKIQETKGASTVSMAEMVTYVHQAIQSVEPKQGEQQQVDYITSSDLNRILNEKLNNLPATKVVEYIQPQQASVQTPVDYQQLNGVIATTIRETLAGQEHISTFEDASLLYEDSELNVNFSDNNDVTHSIVKVSDSKEEKPVKKQVSKRKERKLAKKQAKKLEKQNIIAREKKLKQIKKRGIIDESDGKFVTDHYYYMQTIYLQKNRKKKRRRRIFLSIFLPIFFICLLFYVMYVLYGTNQEMAVIKDIVGFFDKYTTPFSDFMKSISEPLAKLFKSGE